MEDQTQFLQDDDQLTPLPSRRDYHAKKKRKRNSEQTHDSNEKLETVGAQTRTERYASKREQEVRQQLKKPQTNQNVKMEDEERELNPRKKKSKRERPLIVANLILWVFLVFVACILFFTIRNY